MFRTKHIFLKISFIENI